LEKSTEITKKMPKKDLKYEKSVPAYFLIIAKGTFLKIFMSN